MSRLSVGLGMPDFMFDTPYEQGRMLGETVRSAEGKTALVFLRYYGCPLCQYDIAQIAEHYAQIRAEHAQVLVVLQSDPVKLAGQLAEGDLPFDIICDPKMELYKRFEITPAASKAKMADLKTITKIVKATAKGYKHGDYEGDEMQLPALFVMEPDMTLTHVHYGKAVGDIPSVEEMVKILR